MREEIFVLPQDHPDSARVRSISNQILQALQSDLKSKQMSGLAYSPKKNISSNVVDKKEVTVPWWHQTKFSTGHLEGLNWEVVVVDLNIKNAYVLPGGKIVVYNGILRLCHEVSPDYCPCFCSNFFSNEKEADYIGLLLMASAAYDPREAPKVYEMLDDDDFSDSKFKKYRPFSDDKLSGL